MGMVIQAVVVNLIPVIFVSLRSEFTLTYSHLGLLIFTNFITQLIVDIAMSKAVEKYGFRPFAIS